MKEAVPLATKTHYKTKQMEAILSFMQSMQGHHVTVHDICEHFDQAGISVGKTTVYRNLDRMVRQGVVAKYIVDGTSGACFEYIGEPDMPEESPSFHCKCKQCGKLTHLECDEVSEFGRHMLRHHDFEMDPMRTVFYGVCGDCRKARGKKTSGR
jgi:Fur family ferric uptake transcriptional regulator